MQYRSFIVVSTLIFLIVAVAHLTRIVLAWPVQIGSLDVPMWISWIALVVTAALSAWGFGISRS